MIRTLERDYNIMKYKQYNVPDPIYRAHLTIMIGDLDEIRKHLISLKFPEEPLKEINVGKFIFHNDMHVIIMKKYDIFTLIHEIIHVAFAVMYGRGIPIRYENDETITYYVEMVLKNSLKEMNKKICTF